MKGIRVTFLLSIAAVGATILLAPSAAAHPLGNFSINRFSGLEVFTDRVVVHHVVDVAEIPTFQETRVIDTNRNGNVEAQEIEEYAAARARTLLSKISLRVDGAETALHIARARASVSPGQGGLKVLRVESTFVARLSSAEVSIRYSDDNYPDRVGWREVVAYGSGGQGISASSVPTKSVTHGLREYPRDRLASPLDQTAATVDAAPGATSDEREGARPGQTGSSGLLSSRFASLIEHELSIPFLLFALCAAVAAGGLHALGPGHGKSVMAAYLLGTEGKMRHAVAVGVAVSIMHTLSVIVLGLATLLASSAFPAERVYPYLSLASGTVVLLLGAWLLWSRLAARRRPPGASRHEFGHAHGGSFHYHAPGPAPLSWKGLGVLALSGGLLPSPTALVVLLGAVALKRVALGLILVGAFSLGLAGALTLLGMLVSKARGLAQARLGERAAALLPVLSAGAVCLLGLFLTTRGLAGL